MFHEDSVESIKIASGLIYNMTSNDDNPNLCWYIDNTSCKFAFEVYTDNFECPLGGGTEQHKFYTGLP